MYFLIWLTSIPSCRRWSKACTSASNSRCWLCCWQGDGWQDCKVLSFSTLHVHACIYICQFAIFLYLYGYATKSVCTNAHQKRNFYPHYIDPGFNPPRGPECFVAKVVCFCKNTCSLLSWKTVHTLMTFCLCKTTTANIKQKMAPPGPALSIIQHIGNQIHWYWTLFWRKVTWQHWSVQFKVHRELVTCAFTVTSRKIAPLFAAVL